MERAVLANGEERNGSTKPDRSLFDCQIILYVSSCRNALGLAHSVDLMVGPDAHHKMVAKQHQSSKVPIPALPLDDGNSDMFLDDTNSTMFRHKVPTQAGAAQK